MQFRQTTYVRDLPYTGMANGFPGRHVFRIDEKILPGVCIRFDLKFLVCIRLDLNCVLRQNTNNDYSGT